MEWTFRWVMFALIMPIISLFGLIGNVSTIFVLHHSDIQLKKYLVDVLSALACFDILFLLTNFLFITFPNWGIGNYNTVWPGTISFWEIFDLKILTQRDAIVNNFLIYSVNADTLDTYPIFVIVLRPAWKIFLASSIYMTVAVAVNRCLEIVMYRREIPHCLHSFLNSGVGQTLTVFLWANIINLPRWFDYKLVDHNIKHTWLRDDDDYNFYYLGIVTPTCFLAIPLAIMVLSTILMLRELRAVTARVSIREIQRNQEKRNRSISILLIGIIILFVVCHFPKVIISCYHRIHLEGDNEAYENDWVKILNVIKHTLAVTNCSLNFAIYCKDLLFRQCAMKIYNNFIKCPQSPTENTTSTTETLSLKRFSNGT